MSAPPPKSTTFHFLRLPLEVQHQVFDHLCRSRVSTSRARKQERTSFLLTSKFIYHTFAPRFYEDAVFSYISIEHLINNSLPGSTTTCLENLRFVRLELCDYLRQRDPRKLVDKGLMLLNLLRMVPALSTVKKLDVDFGLFPEGNWSPHPGTLFRQMTKNEILRHPVFQLASRGDPPTDSRWWWSFVADFTYNLMAMMENKVKDDFRQYNVRHCFRLLFELDDGKVVLSELEEGGRGTVPASFKSVRFQGLRTTLNLDRAYS